jgi:hypothetical protein
MSSDALDSCELGGNGGLGCPKVPDLIGAPMETIILRGSQCRFRLGLLI